MEEQRGRGAARAPRGSAAGAAPGASALDALGDTPPTRFTGYETEQQHTTVLAVEPAGDGAAQAAGGERRLVKLAESPFYLAGGGQVSDVGVIECEHGDCRARVEDVLAVGDGPGAEGPRRAGRAAPRRAGPRPGRPRRCATRPRPTTRPPTCSTPPCASGWAATCARPAPTSVPTSSASTSATATALSAEELRDVEDRVNGWIARNDPVRPIETTLEEAKRLGAMALFGEKYGDVVRMVEIGDGEYSRELCGGTHVRSTAEIGAFHILSETSSAANVRRIEALTGPRGGRAPARRTTDCCGMSRPSCARRPSGAPEAVRTQLERAQAARKGGPGGRRARRVETVDLDALAGGACAARRRAAC